MKIIHIMILLILFQKLSIHTSAHEVHDSDIALFILSIVAYYGGIKF